nr:efflux RND transporter permease subunit [bacterium]
MNKGEHKSSWLDGIIRFCLENKLLVVLFMLLAVTWGVMVAPFDWDLGDLPRDPVSVDAIPDIGENQQIVFTKWMGRSPQDVEDQISYPLTVSLLGIPGVKTVRSYSMFGFSSIYVIFDEDVEFYWSRSRLLEKLNSLPPGALPSGVQPSLGPDATALGQVFWYTLEGRDANGDPTGAWGLDELRSIQDWQVRYALLAAEGVSEVASVGGFMREYQIDVDPDAMRAYGVALGEVFSAVKMSNKDVGARSIEINKAEYVIRGLGFIKSLSDIENTVIKSVEGAPILVKHIAHVSHGPALRRGALDKEGAEAVGGVVVVRYGENPLKTIAEVKKKIAEIAPGLPRKTLDDGSESQVTIVPFYDRTGLIHETLGTLSTALFEEILVTIIVIILLLMHLRSSLLIAGLLPLAVLISFIAMKMFGVDANVVALSGIAIAIGTMVDMGIVVSENIVNGLAERASDESPFEAVFRATSEVGGAVLTAVSTTVISFLPVFTMEAAEGKLFKPLAYTKTFALISSVIVAIVVIPPMAQLLFTNSSIRLNLRRILTWLLLPAGVFLAFTTTWWIGVLVILIGLYHLLIGRVPQRIQGWGPIVVNYFAVVVVGLILSGHWTPLGPEKGMVRNFLFVAALIGSLLLAFYFLQRFYRRMLAWCLDHKILFMSLPVLLLLSGLLVWQGFDSVFSWVPQSVRVWRPVSTFAHAFPGLGKEFMPPLDEGSFLLMPTTMPHASIGEVLDVLQKQDMSIAAIPEVESAVGKLGRAETPLDPAPVSMIETIINYSPEYLVDEKGHRLRFKFDPDEEDFFRDENGEPVPAADGESYIVRGVFERDEAGRLVPDRRGRPFRLWRPALDPDLNEDREAWAGIVSPDDIWDTILDVATVPGTTSAPKLQPIAARIVMLQSGMRAPMGIKVKGPDLESIDLVGLDLERLLKQVPSIEPASVIADRIVGKPYLEIDIDRESIARYGIHLQSVQDVIEVAIGGKPITTTVEGRE